MNIVGREILSYITTLEPVLIGFSKAMDYEITNVI